MRARTRCLTSTMELVLLAALAGCGSNGPNTNGPGGDGGNADGAGGPQACSITLSGAVTGTFACDPNSPGLIYTVQSNNSLFNMQHNQNAMDPQISIYLSEPGMPPASNMWSSNDPASATTTGQVNVATSSMSWMAQKGGSADQGSYLLSLSSVTQTYSNNVGAGFTAHGTLTATVPPAGGGTSVVNLTATF